MEGYINIEPNDANVLNDVYTLQASGTEIMETCHKAAYQFSKTGDAEILEESLRDVANMITSAASKVSSGIVSFSKSIMKNFDSYFKEFDTFAKKHKSYFASLPDDWKMEFEGYRFSVIDRKVDLSELGNIVSGYNLFLKDLQKIASGNLDPNQVRNMLDSYMSESNLSKIRAEVLGYSSPISKNDFIGTVKKFYRSGDITPIKLTVTKRYILNSIKELDELRKSINATVTDMEFTINSFQTLSSFFSNAILLLGSDQNQEEYPISSISITGKSKNFVSIKSEGTIRVSLENFQIIMDVLRLKYYQVSELQSIVQIVLSERLSALKSQMSQNTKILKTSLMYSEAEKSLVVPVLAKNLATTESADVFNTDYTTLLMEEFILTESMRREALECRYTEEMTAVAQCFENMLVSSEVLEGIGSASKEKIENFKATITAFFEKIIEIFRRKSIDYSQRYVPWVKDMNKEGKFKENVNNVGAITASPFWKVDSADADMNDIISAINTGKSNKDFEKLPFTSKFVNNAGTLDEYNNIRSDIAGYLKNYFRFHVKNAETVKKEEISGNDLVNKIDTMVNYVISYGNYVKVLERSRDDMLKSIDDISAVSESVSYLNLECRPVSETDLTLLEGYQIILEEEIKSGAVVNANGEKESATSVETSEDKAKKDAKENGKPDPSSASTRYITIFQQFFQLAISSWMTATEERYISYLNMLFKIAGERPKVDKNGKYVKTEKKEEDVTKVGESVIAESTFYTKPAGLKGLSLYK